MVSKKLVFKRLGTVLGIDIILNKQMFGWAWEKVQSKFKTWGFLLSFKSTVKIINSYLIFLFSFNCSLLKIAKVSWKEFLKPIKNLMWRNNSSSKIH